MNLYLVLVVAVLSGCSFESVFVGNEEKNESSQAVASEVDTAPEKQSESEEPRQSSPITPRLNQGVDIKENEPKALALSEEDQRSDESGTSHNAAEASSDKGTTEEKKPDSKIKPDPEPEIALALSGAPILTLVEGDMFNFEPQVTYTGKQPLIFQINNLPNWATFDTTTGKLSGQPKQAGTYSNILIFVTDTEKETQLSPFSVTVQPVLALDGFAPSVINQGDDYSFQVDVTYTGNEALSFNASGLPSWLSLNAETGLLSGKASESGLFQDINISVNAGQRTASFSAFSIQVKPNNPPVISGMLPASARVGVLYEFEPEVSDLDLDTLTFEGNNFPDWMSINAFTGRVSGMPTEIGYYSGLSVKVSDQYHTVSTPYTNLTVSPNLSPSISGQPAGTIKVGESYDFKPIFNDPEDDELRFDIQHKPEWATFDSSTGQLIGSPIKEDAGEYAGIVISVMDQTNRVSLPAFSITVTPLE